MRSLCFGSVLVLSLSACGDGGGGSGAGGGGAGSGGAAPCSDAASCAYPSKGLEVTVREGFSVDDPLTGRNLPLLARIPEGAGPFPVVIWSHGGGFLETGHRQSEAWGTTLARHGFVVLHIAHSPITSETGLALCELGSLDPAQCASSTTDDEDATGLVALVKSRDVIAVLDALPTLAAAAENQGGPAIDVERVAVAGWSAGSRSAMVTMGASFEVLPGEPAMSMGDARVDAAFALSPAGPGFGGFFEDGANSSWSSSRGPILFATGQNDVKASKPGLDGPVRRRAFENQPADGQRWLLYSTLPVGVGAHGTYDLADAGSSDARLADLSSALDSTARAFFDAHLLGDAEAAAWLASDRAKIMAGEADWVTR